MSIINRVKSKVLPVLLKVISKYILPALKVVWPILAALSLLYPPLALAAVIINVLKSGCETLVSRYDKQKKAVESQDKVIPQEKAHYKYNDTLQDLNETLAKPNPFANRVSARERYRYILYANKLSNAHKDTPDKQGRRLSMVRKNRT